MVKYVTNMADATCVFCKIIKREIAAKIVMEDDDVLAFEDVNPQAPVHIMIIPKRHIEKVSDLTAGDTALAGKLLITAKDIAKTLGIDPSGYRIVVNCNKDAGQAVFHMHLHMLGGRIFRWPPG